MNFNTRAANWDTDKRIKGGEIITAEIMKSIDIKGNYNALEFGCGTGILSFNMKDKFKHITLIDTSEGMIEKLNNKIQESKAKNMMAVRADITQDTELTKERFDVIYSSMALHHILDVETTLKHLYGMLNKEGYMCIVELAEEDGSFHKAEKDFNGHNGFNQEKLKNSLEEIGFKDVKWNTFYKDVKDVKGMEVNYSLFLMIGRK